MPEQKKAVVPRLRFPEFRDAGPWEVKQLGEVAEIYQPETIPLSSLSNNGEFLVYGANGIIGRFDCYNHEQPQIAVTCRGSTCGEVMLTRPRSWITGNSMVVNVDNSPGVIKGFLYFQLKGTNWNYLITGSGQPQITGEIKKHKVALPSLDEQQKIADCLSSLDELIELQAKKLEALQAHKKGLMQQLFPREGETTPRLRFPEFRNAEPWEVKRLSDIARHETSSLTLNTLVLTDSGYPIYGANGCIGFIDSFEQEDKYIAMVKDGSGVGRLTIREGKSSVLSTLTYIKPREKSVLVTWLYYCLSALDLSCFIKGSGIPHIYFSDVGATKVGLPSLPEQQKIADCLSSLDELIELQAKQLEALQAHKKGLMQQLFPQEIDL